MVFHFTLTEVEVKTCVLKLAYLKTIRAILKIIELIIATIIIGTLFHFFNDSSRVPGDSFFLLIIMTFYICTICLFISEWVVWSSIESNSKSMFEIVFFVFMVILLLASTVNSFSNSISHTEQSVHMAYVISSAFECILIGVYSTDIVLCLCIDCCRKKGTKPEELN